MSRRGRVDASEFALGELSGGDREEGERLMAEDDSFRAEVERLRPLVSQLEELPPEAWQELRPRARPTPRRRGMRLALRPAWAGAAVVLLLAAGLGIGLALNRSDDSANVPVAVALEPVTRADTGASGEAALDKREGRASVTVSGLRPSRGGERYELWLMNGPNQLVSLGKFPVPDSRRASVSVSLPSSAGDYRFIDISREPPDGDPGHSAISVLRAEVRAG